MKIIFVNRFYWPDETATAQLLTDLAEGLAARGRDVTVIASHPGRGTVPRSETRRSVRIERVGSRRHAERTLAAKAVDFSAFFWGSLRRMAQTSRRGDVIVSLTDPPLLGLGAWLIARMRGARLFHWTQDIYPEIALAVTGHRWLRALLPARNAAWRGADGCVTLGHDMAAVLAGAGVPAARIHVVPNWAPAGLSVAAPEDAAALRDAWGLAGKFVVAYSGNLGRVHDMESIVSVAEILRGDPDIMFAVIGEGAGRSALEAEVRRRGLPNVRLFPAQPRAQLATVLAIGDAHLVTLRADCARFVFPSKLHGIAAAGKPLLFIGPPDCEPARLVSTRGFGYAYSSDEMPALAARLRSLRESPDECARLGAAAARFAAESGGPEAACDAWDRMLDLGAC